MGRPDVQGRVEPRVPARGLGRRGLPASPTASSSAATIRPRRSRSRRCTTSISAPVIVTDPASAETIKYAANAFLATKLSFINAIAAICEGVGADVNDVVVGMGSDKRIGQDFLRPGPGWGGSCFDGAETCIVRDHDGTRLTRFDELAGLPLDKVEVLSWANGQIIPEFQPALALTERPYSGEMVHIRTKMGRRLTVTADHPMIVQIGRRRSDDQARRANSPTNDWLPVSLGSPLADGLGPDHASMIEAIAPAGLDWTRHHSSAHGRANGRGAQGGLIIPLQRPLGLPTEPDPATHRGRLLRVYPRGATARNGHQRHLRAGRTSTSPTSSGRFSVSSSPRVTSAPTAIAARLLVIPPHRRAASRRLRRDVLARPRRQDDSSTIDDDDAGVDLSRLLAAWFEHVLGVGTNCYTASDSRHDLERVRVGEAGAAAWPVGGRRIVVAAQRRPVGRTRVRNCRRPSLPMGCSACWASSASSLARRSLARRSRRWTRTGW